MKEFEPGNSGSCVQSSILRGCKGAEGIEPLGIERAHGIRQKAVLIGHFNSPSFEF